MLTLKKHGSTPSIEPRLFLVPAAAKADRFSVTRENEEGTRLPYLQDASELSDAALCRANGCSVAHVPKEEGTRSPFLQDVSEASDAAL